MRHLVVLIQVVQVGQANEASNRKQCELIPAQVPVDINDIQCTSGYKQHKPMDATHSLSRCERGMNDPKSITDISFPCKELDINVQGYH